MRHYNLVKQMQALEVALKTSTLPIEAVLAFLDYNQVNYKLPFRESLKASLTQANEAQRPEKAKEVPYSLEEISYAFNLINETERTKSPFSAYVSDFTYERLSRLEEINEADKILVAEMASFNLRYALGLSLASTRKKIEEHLGSGGFQANTLNLIKLANNASKKLEELLEETLPQAQAELSSIRNFEYAEDIEQDQLFESLFDIDKKEEEIVLPFVQREHEIPENKVQAKLAVSEGVENPTRDAVEHVASAMTEDISRDTVDNTTSSMPGHTVSDMEGNTAHDTANDTSSSMPGHTVSDTAVHTAHDTAKSMVDDTVAHTAPSTVEHTASGISEDTAHDTANDTSSSMQEHTVSDTAVHTAHDTAKGMAGDTIGHTEPSIVEHTASGVSEDTAHDTAEGTTADTPTERLASAPTFGDKAPRLQAKRETKVGDSQVTFKETGALVQKISQWQEENVYQVNLRQAREGLRHLKGALFSNQDLLQRAAVNTQEDFEKFILPEITIETLVEELESAPEFFHALLQDEKGPFFIVEVLGEALFEEAKRHLKGNETEKAEEVKEREEAETFTAEELQDLSEEKLLELPLERGASTGQEEGVRRLLRSEDVTALFEQLKQDFSEKGWQAHVKAPDALSFEQEDKKEHFTLNFDALEGTLEFSFEGSEEEVEGILTDIFSCIGELPVTLRDHKGDYHIAESIDRPFLNPEEADYVVHTLSLSGKATGETRRLDGQEIKEVQAELLLEEEQPKNFIFPEDVTDFYPQTPTQKVEANLEALTLVKRLESESRLATTKEQEILARYVGWGGLANTFFDEHHPRFQTQRALLKTLVSEKEYEAMEASSLTAYYTPPELIRSLYKVLADLGFEGGRILDPSMGTGNFFASMPEELRTKSQLFGVELDAMTGAIARQLNQTAEIKVQGFETTRFQSEAMDVVITNVPFGNIPISSPDYDKTYSIHNFFLKKALDLVHEGGIVAVITSTSTLDTKSTLFRKELAETANLLGGVRLPSHAFKKIAGTDVTADVLLFQKNTRHLEMTPEKRETYAKERGREAVLYNQKRWIETLPFVSQEGEIFTDVLVNEYFNSTLSRPYVTDASDSDVTVFDRRTLGVNTIKNYNGHTLSVQPTKGSDALWEEVYRQLSATIEGEYFGEHKKEVERQVERAHDVPEVLVDLEKYTHAVVDGKVYCHSLQGIHEKLLDRSFTVKEGEEGKTRNQNLFERHKANIFDQEESFNDQDKRVSTTYFYKEAYTPEKVKRIEGMLEIKRYVQHVMNFQRQPGYDQSDFERHLKDLNTVYDRFVSHYGPLNHALNRQVMQEDDYYPLLASIEVEREDVETGEKVFSKGALFKEATIRGEESKPEIKTAQDALFASLNFKNKVDLDYMLELYPTTQEALLRELEGELFINPEKYRSGRPDFWEVKADYLSGDVKEKLAYLTSEVRAELVEKLSLEDFSYSLDGHYAALSAAQPVDLTFNDISFKIGSKWIPLEVYKAFMQEVLEQSPLLSLNFSELTSTYEIKGPRQNNVVTTQRFGVASNGRRSYTGLDLFETLLNLKTPTVKYSDEKGKNYTDEAATAAYAGKAIDLQEAFQTFVREKKAEVILSVYNEKYNRYVPKNFETDYLTVSGLNRNIELRPHQKSAVARAISEKRALFAHEVGAGKTLSMIASGMKMKELGMIHKPLYVVPSNLTSQFGRELLHYFPGKKVLITTKYDFAKSRRKEFVARIANGNYDAVIIGDSQFQKIPLSAARQEEWLEREKQAATRSLRGGQNRYTVKQLKLKVKNIEEQLVQLSSLKRDKFLNFEDLGVDFLMVDEAHRFKNVGQMTAMQDVVGINKTTSKRAVDLSMKLDYIHELNDNRGVIFSTGTPISNSISELYTMMQYLMPDVLEENHLANFDDFVGNFGTVKTEFEATVSNTYKKRTRFAKFSNMPELIKLFKNVADIKLAADLNLPVPTHKIIPVIVEKSEALEEFSDELLDRAEAIEMGLVDPTEDNMLKITNESKRSSLDLRLIDSQRYADEVPEKLLALVDHAYREYTASQEIRGTQIIFSDIGVPHSKRKNPDGSENRFSVYEEVAKLLVEKGVPREEIAFIHDAPTDLKKEKLFKEVREGKIRFLLGATENGGTGVNIQDLIVAIHHLDIPWRPSDLTQRNGRGIRQGNQNTHVNIYQYSTKGTLDAFMWQALATKSAFIEQVMRGESAIREIEDMTSASASFSEFQAASADNPYMAELAQTKVEFEMVQAQRNNFYSTQVKNEKLIEEATGVLEQTETRLAFIDQDIEKAQVPYEEDFSFKFGQLTLTDKAETAAFIQETILLDKTQTDALVFLGDYRGFEVFYKKTASTTLFDAEGATLYLKGALRHTVPINIHRKSGILTRLNNKINGLEEEKEALMKRLEETTQSKADMEAMQGKQFPKEIQYVETKEKLHTLSTQAATANAAYRARREARRRQAPSERSFEPTPKEEEVSSKTDFHTVEHQLEASGFKDKQNALATISWNETSSHSELKFLNQSHQGERLTVEHLEAMLWDEVILEQEGQPGAYKVETTLGRLYLGEGFESNKGVYQALSEKNQLNVDVQAFYASIAPEKPNVLSLEDTLHAVKAKLELSEAFKVKGLGGESFWIVKESLGGILQEVVVEWEPSGEFEISEAAESLTEIPFFEQLFREAIREILEEDKEEEAGALEHHEGFSVQSLQSELLEIEAQAEKLNLRLSDTQREKIQSLPPEGRHYMLEELSKMKPIKTQNKQEKSQEEPEAEV